MDNEVGAGAGASGDAGYLGAYDYESLRAAIMADSPDALNQLVLTWERIAGVLHNVNTDLGAIASAAGDAVDTPRAGPAFVEALVGLAARIHSLATNTHANALANNQADLALRDAQAEIARLDGDGTRKMVDLRTGKDQRAPEAARIAQALNNAYGDVINMIVVPSEDRARAPVDPSGDPSPDAAGGGSPVIGTVPGRGRPVAPGHRPGITTGNRPDASHPAGRLPAGPGPNPTAPVSARPGRETGNASSPGTTAPGRRVGVPGGRSGVPIGGARIPVSRGGILGGPGTSGVPASAPTPGGAGPAGSGHPARPGMPLGGVPGHGAGGPQDRRGRRLTWYERIEDEFVDKRGAIPPGGTIGADRTRSTTVDAGPAVIGNQKHKASPVEETDEAWAVPDTAVEAPQGFPDKLDNGSFSQRDGTRFQVRRRSGGA
ncbi:MAG: hypothetical protein ACRDT4_15995 [Micromonosporaceae bacterium]